MTRTGIGYDSHRFVEGRPLVLGGLTIPHTHGLAGHSDADAVAHALTDAILGAAAAGDIGTHFPDTDPRWKDADSMQLLRSACAVVAARGFRVAQVDVTVILERPRLGPHVPAMRDALAAALGLSTGEVSVKAKTNEGMGFIGRGEGIATMAVATLEGELIASLLDSLATMPPLAVYAVLAALSLLENIFPPVPGDAVLALGAFLTVNGPLDPVTLFFVCWIPNFLGSIGVYFLARRVGGGLFESRMGRQLLSPESIASLERGYIRYGLAGVFLGRILPGVRAVVAPFAGLMRLPPLRALVPIGLASALWFAGMIVLGRYIGQSWEGIQRVLRDLNTGLAVVGLVVVAGITVAWLRARAARRARLWDALRVALDHEPAPRGAVDPALQAVAAFVLEMAEADEHLKTAEREALTARLRARFNHLPGQVSADRAAVEAVILRATSAYQANERRRLVDRMRHVAHADGVVTPAEAAMIARAAALLGVEPQ